MTRYPLEEHEFKEFYTIWNLDVVWLIVLWLWISKRERQDSKTSKFDVLTCLRYDDHKQFPYDVRNITLS